MDAPIDKYYPENYTLEAKTAKFASLDDLISYLKEESVRMVLYCILRNPDNTLKLRWATIPNM